MEIPSINFLTEKNLDQNSHMQITRKADLDRVPDMGTGIVKGTGAGLAAGRISRPSVMLPIMDATTGSLS